MEGVDFAEKFAATLRMESTKIMMQLAVSENYSFAKFDIETFFLYGEMEGDDIFVKQPYGYEEKGKENLVCRLKKSLYGIPPAPRLAQK